MRTFAIVISAAGIIFHAAGQPALTNATPSARPELYQRVYQTDTNSFFQKLRTLMRANDEQPDFEVLWSYFKQKGIDVSPPFSFYYKPRTGLLIIWATEQDQKGIKLLLTELQSPK